MEDGIGYRMVERELLVVGNLEEAAPRLGLRAQDLLAEPRRRVRQRGLPVEAFGFKVDVLYRAGMVDS